MRIWTRKKNYRLAYPFTGAVLGLGSPLGCLFLRWLGSDHMMRPGAWAIFEIGKHFFFYTYETVGTVMVFLLAGAWTGRTVDRLDKLSERRKELALRDPLTGLYNRRYLTERLAEELARASRQNQPLSYLMVDIDHFKNLNDEHGHLAGDHVLKQLARRLSHACRAIDIVGRFGGEEFFVILPGADLGTAREVAERIRASMAETPFSYGNVSMRVRVSVGGAQRASGLTKVEQLIESADHALYQAKAAGRNCAVLASS